MPKFGLGNFRVSAGKFSIHSENTNLNILHLKIVVFDVHIVRTASPRKKYKNQLDLLDLVLQPVPLAQLNRAPNLGSILGRVILKMLKMVPVATLLVS